jgi:hypothetical protein
VPWTRQTSPERNVWMMVLRLRAFAAAGFSVVEAVTSVCLQVQGRYWVNCKETSLADPCPRVRTDSGNPKLP